MRGATIHGGSRGGRTGSSRRALRIVALAVLGSGGTARALPVADLSAALKLDAAYDSNVFNGRGPDFVTRISPRVAADIHDLRFDLQLGYDLGLWFYALSKAERSVNQHGVAALDYRVTRRLNLHLGDEVIYAHDPGFLFRAGVVAPQTSIFDNTLDVLLGYQVTRATEAGVLYSFRRTLFGPPPPGDAPIYNGDEHDGAVSFAWLPDRPDELRLSYRAQYFTASDAGLAVTQSPALAWRRAILRVLELKVEAGPVAYEQLDTAIVRVPGVGATGWTWRGAGVLRYASRRVHASLSVVRDLVGGTGAASVLWADYVYAQVVAQVAREIEVRGGVGVFENGLAPDQSRLYDGFSVDAGAEWRMRPEVRLGAYYSFRWQETNAPGAEAGPLPSVTRHVVGVRLSFVLGAEARPPRHHHGG